MFKLLLYIGALAGFAAGCMTIGPAQKARLAKPEMQFVQSNPGRFFLDHSTSTVEQAEGGDGKVGGGCGCR